MAASFRLNVSGLDAKCGEAARSAASEATGILREGANIANQAFPLPPVQDVSPFLPSSPLCPSARSDANKRSSSPLSRAQLDRFGSDVDKLVKPDHGTTTLGFIFENGVIIAVDSRASQGSYVSSQTVKKVIEINPYLLGTMAGGAADCAFWQRNLGMQCRMFELKNKKRITVCAASKMLANTMYSYKGMGLSMGSMIAGWDPSGPAIYYVDSDGQRTKGTIFSVGSGSLYAYGVLDQGYKWDMDVETAAELGQRAIYHAQFRDAVSGGTCSVYHITQNGWVKLRGANHYDMHWNKYSKDGTHATCASSVI